MRIVFLVVGIAWPGLAEAQSPKESALPITKLSLKAAAAPTPPLRYELLPWFRDQTPGNAALNYYHAMLYFNQANGRQPSKEHQEQFLKIEAMLYQPPDKWNLQELKDYLGPYSKMLRELEIAATREKCDWELDRRIVPDDIDSLLVDTQKMREMARLLSIRCRIHRMEGNVPEELHDIQVGLAMARNFGEQPTFVSALVGMALGAIFLGHLEQTLTMPDCPNLYWSLTALPHPFIDMRTASQGEFRMMDAALPILREIEKPMTVEQARKSLDLWAKGLSFGGEVPDYLKSPLVLATLVAMREPIARQSLLKTGKTEVQLNSMPAAQIVLLESVLEYRNLRDEWFVWFNAPYSEARQGLEKLNDNLRNIRKDGTGNLFTVGLSQSLPASEQLHFAAVRTERNIAVLRTIEALCLHAAANGGRFPAKLADIVLVPVPGDPETGKPFEYKLTDDGKALLSYAAPKGKAPHAGNTKNYELTLIK